MKMKLPAIFKPILWSYDFEKCDPVKMERTIISQAINYGTLDHWKWIRSFYGDEKIKKTLSFLPATEINLKSRLLAEVLFDFNNWNYAPRGIKR